MSLFGFELSAGALLLGLFTGITYGLLAVGLVLVFRSSRFVNFAHGEIGAFGAAVLAVFVKQGGIPYWIALPAAMVVSAALAAYMDAVILRRLRDAPRLMSMIATLGFGQLLVVLSALLSSRSFSGFLFPKPPGLPTFTVGGLFVSSAHSAMILLTPVLMVALVVFLRRSRYGLAIRGAAANPDAAALAGISPRVANTLTWGIAGAISAFTAALILPTRGLVVGAVLGPSLLLRALAAAVIGRMTNVTTAFAAGVAIGVVEQEVRFNQSGGIIEVILFVAILVALLLQSRGGTRERERGSWTAVQAWSPLPDAFRRIWVVRNLGWLVAGVGLVAALVLPAVSTNATNFSYTMIAAFALVGVSVGLITGMGGQLSLGQFAVGAVGAVVSWRLTEATGNYVLGLVVAGIAAAAVSVLVGVPALRVRGLLFAVTTLSFALAMRGWFLQQPWMLGGGADPGRPLVGDFVFDTARRYTYFVLPVLAAGLLLARNVRAGAFGRKLRALRDNEDAARSFAVPATLVKLQAYALAGFIAGLGGAVYGHALSSIGAAAFETRFSVDVVAMTVVGGVGVLAGPLLGALYIVGLPRFLPLDTAGLAATALGWLVLILHAPGGVAGLIRPARERLVAALATRFGSGEPAPGDEMVTAAPRVPVRVSPPPDATGRPVLEINGLTKRYGGITALDDVHITVAEHETVGLIGPNGAGKTTVFEIVSGFTRPDAGSVAFAGGDVTGLGPEACARLGLVRSFQDSALFDTLTVLETVMLACERTDPSPLWPSIAGLSRMDRVKESRARETIAAMGLERYRDTPVAALSTGTRRICELACLVVLEPRVLLLDEPSSGIAQRETEALGELLSSVRESLGTTLVVIEHDMPLIAGLSDRLVALETGRVVAEGPPDEVQRHPKVVESFLGDDPAAIGRSGLTGARAPNKLKRRSDKRNMPVAGRRT